MVLTGTSLRHIGSFTWDKPRFLELPNVNILKVNELIMYMLHHRTNINIKNVLNWKLPIIFL
jgi:hypothetical protein